VSRRYARLQRDAGEVVRALVDQVQKHAGDYHHKLDRQVLERAEAFLGQLGKGRRRGVRKASRSGG
jgi:hypothetical protein